MMPHATGSGFQTDAIGTRSSRGPNSTKESAQSATRWATTKNIVSPPR